MRKERAEAWRQAQIVGKRVCQVGTLKPTSPEQIQQYFEKSSMFSFAGKAGEAHRVFLFSSELFRESQSSPWATPGELGKHADHYLAWLEGVKGNSDVIMVSDGRSRVNRKTIENFLEKKRNVHETWLVFNPTKRLGRRVVFAGDNKEMCWCPCLCLGLSSTRPRGRSSLRRARNPRTRARTVESPQHRGDRCR